MIKTKIEWCDSSCNFTTGCEGCELAVPGDAAYTCYAKGYHQNRMAAALPQLYAADFHTVRLAPGRMAKAAGWSDLADTDRPDKPWLNGMPRVIFVGDLGDVFSAAVPFDYLKSEFIDNATSVKGRRHIWMVLTKQPQRAAAFSRWLAETHGIDWPDNIWPGTSITRQATTPRIDHLMRVGGVATTRFISAEPVLGPLDVSRHLAPVPRCEKCGKPLQQAGTSPVSYWPCPGHTDVGAVFVPEPAAGIRLLIVGGESGPGARPCQLEWVRSIVRQCRAAGTPVFVKQLGAAVRMTFADWQDGFQAHTDRHGFTLDEPHGEVGTWRGIDRKGGDPEEWPEDLHIRQFPNMVSV